MSIENELSDLLERKPTMIDDPKFAVQIEQFENFERQLSDGGYKIERQKFTIPLMERFDASFAKVGYVRLAGSK
jgi:hypothetical protein